MVRGRGRRTTGRSRVSPCRTGRREVERSPTVGEGDGRQTKVQEGVLDTVPTHLRPGSFSSRSYKPRDIRTTPGPVPLCEEWSSVLTDSSCLFPTTTAPTPTNSVLRQLKYYLFYYRVVGTDFPTLTLIERPQKTRVSHSPTRVDSWDPVESESHSLTLSVHQRY